MAHTRGNFADILDPSFRHIIFDEIDKKPSYFDKILHIEGSTRSEEKLSQINQLGLMPEKSEGANVVYDTAKQGYDVTAVHTSYALAISITRELYDDAQFGKIKRIPNSIKHSKNETVEVIANSIFNNGFSSSYTFGDGVELFSELHPSPSGGTQKNELATPADLAATSLKQAIEDLESTTDSRGNQLRLKANLLMVPPALEWTAMELLKSAKDPESANNAINPIQNRNLELFINPYLTDTNAWFLMDKYQHFLYFYWRTKYELTNWTDDNTGNANFKGFMRFSQTAGDWRGVFGTAGA